MAIWVRNEGEYLRIKTKFAHLWDDPDFHEVLKMVRVDLKNEMADTNKVDEMVDFNMEIRALDRLTGKIRSLFNEKVAETIDADRDTDD